MFNYCHIAKKKKKKEGFFFFFVHKTSNKIDCLSGRGIMSLANQIYLVNR